MNKKITNKFFKIILTIKKITQKIIKSESVNT